MFVDIWGHLRYFFIDFSEYVIILGCSTALSAIFLYALSKSRISKNTMRVCLLLIFSLLSFVYLYSGFEAYFRYRFDESDSLGFLRVTTKWFQRHVITNNYQYRDKNFTIDKTPGKVRIGVMGDSNGFGYGIRDVNDRFSNILEKKLLTNGYNVEVYNFSVSGFDTEQELKEYKRVEKFNFDILVWEYFLNDIEEATRSAGRTVLQKAQTVPQGIISFLSDHSFFFDYIYWRLDARYDNTFVGIRKADIEQYSIPEIFNHHRTLIDTFIPYLKSQNKKIVVVVFPFFYFFPHYPSDTIAVHEKMNQIFTEDNVDSLIDLRDSIKEKDRMDLVVGPYDSHPNEYVHTVVADKLYNALIPLLDSTVSGQTIVHQ
jgi:hypothetical protein